MNGVNLYVNHDMQVIGVAITVALAIIPQAPEKSVWSIPVKQADESPSGGFSLLLNQKQYHKTLTKEHRRFWKRILIVDDDTDVTITFKAMIEDNKDKVLELAKHNELERLQWKVEYPENQAFMLEVQKTNATHDILKLNRTIDELQSSSLQNEGWYDNNDNLYPTYTAPDASSYSIRLSYYWPRQ